MAIHRTSQSVGKALWAVSDIIMISQLNWPMVRDDKPAGCVFAVEWLLNVLHMTPGWICIFFVAISADGFYLFSRCRHFVDAVCFICSNRSFAAFGVLHFRRAHDQFSQDTEDGAMSDEDLFTA
jgi:hypothetical protein